MTSKGKLITLISVGQHNFNSGPDFFNAQLIIDDQLWAGSVEIHIKSSDWYLHGHEKDMNYDNVILHVVWEHDTEIFRKDNKSIPTLSLKNYVVKLYYADGSRIAEGKMNRGKSDINMASMANGLYLLVLRNKAGIIVQQYKLIKN